MNLDIDGIDEVGDKVEQVSEDLTGTPMVKAMNDAAMLVTRTARTEAKVDTGRHRARIVPSVFEEKNTVKGIVGTNLDYGPFAILDTRPHWPPIDALRTWARRHNISAFLVARSIARKGTKGDYSIYKGLEKNATRIVKTLAKAVEGMVKK